MSEYRQWLEHDSYGPRPPVEVRLDRLEDEVLRLGDEINRLLTFLSPPERAPSSEGIPDPEVPA